MKPCNRPSYAHDRKSAACGAGSGLTVAVISQLRYSTETFLPLTVYGNIPNSPLWRLGPDAIAVTLAMSHVWLFFLILPLSRERRTTLLVLVTVAAATGYSLFSIQTLRYYPYRGLLFVPGGLLILVTSYFVAYRWDTKRYQASSEI